MLFRCRFYADGSQIAFICIYEYREHGRALEKRKMHCQITVQKHFQLYGESLYNRVPLWSLLDDLTDEEKAFGEWCEKRRW